LPQIYDTLLQTGKWEGELIHTTKDGRQVNVESRKVLVTEEDGTLLIMETNQDITERKHAQERQQILDRASEKLIASLNYQVTLPEIAQMIVPALADYCRIVLLDEQQQIKDIVAHHIDPEKIALVRALYEQYKDRASSTYGIQKLLETGKPELISQVTDEVLKPTTQENPTLLALVRALGLQSYMGTPLIARGRIIGALTISSAQPHRHYTQDDLLFAQELARRIALALDNAHHYQEAQEAISLRDDFLSMASHELKTPLTSLKMYTQIVQRQFARKGDESLSQSLAKMDAQVNKLTLLIGDLLNVSRIEHGQLALQMDTFDINELVREMVAQVQLTAVRHTIRVEGRITHPVLGDKDRIEQVVLNLLSNAIKYSPGADTVIVRLTPEQDAAAVSVQDFGIGIDPQHLNKIFTRFYRVSGLEEKTFPGLGIGLYLSHEIIRRHGSNLAVESEKGKGSLFRFTLPYSSAAS
jgi:signal transduction histidine kinase